MRVPQSIGEKGSLKWVQKMLAQSPNALETAVRTELAISPNSTIDWTSPRADDRHAEYRDADFLEKLGLERFADDLRGFWPTRGPQWDALGLASDGKVILVEAKAHVNEMTSSCDAGERSREIIDQSLQLAKEHYGAEESADWASGYYQYANRLAHLDFLRQRGVDAHLVFIYVLNDRDMRGPSSAAGWADVIDDCYTKLGLKNDHSIDGVHSIFIDVA
ncbi:MAG TPA: hypothetical protein VES88_01680 [Gemmatimonadaceae bacterium]|nr:hypothetical protein [Gemmatimonadaceae bacterium]